MERPGILIIDDEVQWRDYLIRFLSDAYDVHTASSLQEAIKTLKDHSNIKLVATDIILRSQKTLSRSYTYDIIHELKGIRSELQIIVYSSINWDPPVSLEEMGIDYFTTRSNLGEHLKKIIPDLLAKHNSSKNKEKSILELRDLLREEMEKYAVVKEKTLSIPNEGNFELIKPLIGYKRDIERQLSKFEYSKNVFLMMKFRSNNKDLSDYIIATLEQNGLKGIRADHNDWNITQNVYNPIAVLHCCKFGIALFDEPEEMQAYSPNVAYELGIMHSHNKNCLILRHTSLPAMPFDLIKEIYTNYQKDLELKNILTNWIYQIRVN